MGIRLTKQWLKLDGLEPDEVPGQLGVFQLATPDEAVVYIGYAGGGELFGMRSAVPAAVEAMSAAGVGPPTLVRYELTHGYMSRWEELLMIHEHDTGGLPPANGPDDRPRGRLSPDIG